MTIIYFVWEMVSRT